METLSSIECFVRSAEAGSFSEAARRLGLTAAAVGKNVAKLEANMGVRLFQRSTRSLRLTEGGERFLQEVGGSLATIQSAVANLADAGGQPAGNLKVSMGNAFGREYIVPLLGDFLTQYPAIVPDWHFDNRAVDLIAEGFDAAMGGGFELPPGLVARELAPAHVVMVASPAYLADKPAIKKPEQLKDYDGIFIRSPQTGRIRPFALINSKNSKSKDQMPIDMKVRMTMSDPAASLQAAEMGLGIAVTSMPHAVPHIERGTLVRVLPEWYADNGKLSLYFSAQKLLPAKTRAFVDYIVAHFRKQKLAQRFSAF
ncbi:MAG TPA: LysR substrate-binding domain-containing protein [Rhodocyclaceae bacterium]|nr:LysR substrate-binding domain-containing protein [Rhodocyclaceae bacterium]